MNVDNIFKQIGDSSPDHLAAWLLAQPIETLGPVELIKTELVSEPIRADFTALLRSAKTILHVEFQISRPSTESAPLPFRMLDYWVRLYRRHGMPIEQVLVLVHPRLARTPNVFEVGETRHKFRVMRLWEEDPAPLLADEALLPLATLARTDDRVALISTVAAQVARIEPAERRMQVGVNAHLLAGTVIDWEVIGTMFGDNILKESSVYQHFVMEGEIKGRAEGRAEGLAEGLQKGAELFLVSLLELRFGELPDELKTTLGRFPLETLQELVPVATSCTSIEEFAQATAAMAQTP